MNHKWTLIHTNLDMSVYGIKKREGLGPGFSVRAYLWLKTQIPWRR